MLRETVRARFVVASLLAAFLPVHSVAQTAPAAARRFVTVDIPFKTHDGYDLRGRLTLPDSPGRHAVLIYVQGAEAVVLDGHVQNAKGESVLFNDLYRENLTPLNVGYFSYEGRGVTTGASGRMQIDREVYDTATLDNKALDAIAAVRVLENQPGVDPEQIFLRGVSEGTLLAADTASRIPSEIRGLVLSGVMGTTLRDDIKFMMRNSVEVGFSTLVENFDSDGDGRISAAEYDADPKGYRQARLAGQSFAALDVNHDGSLTMEDLIVHGQPLFDAVDNTDIPTIEAWLKQTSATTIPQGWVKDHFSHAPMWSFLSKLDMPVGIFQGEADKNTSTENVRTLQRQIAMAGRTNIEFHYYPGLEHGLGSNEYFLKGAPSAGYADIFAFIKAHVHESR